MKSLKVFAFIFLLIFPTAVSWGYWVWSPESGKFVNPEGAVQDTAEEQYNYAMQLYKEKDLNGAAKQIEDLLKKFPNSKVAADAEYRLGTIYEEQGEYMKAFGAYKVVVESYPQSERFNEVIEREYRIGNLFLAGKKAKLLGLEILPSYPRAVEIFKHIVQYAPYSDYGAEAQFRLGLTYKKQGNFDEAVQAFQTLVEQYPQSELVPEARYQLAESSYQRSAAQYRDERALDEASKQLDQFIMKYGDTEATEKAVKLRQQVDEKNAEKNYRIGLYYEKTDYVKSALIYYSDVARRYPNTEWGKKAADKMKSLESPAEFHSAEAKKIHEQLKTLEEKLAALPESDKVGRGQIQREIERLKNREKMLDKGKVESLKRRAADIRRREHELREKFKTLEKRKKLLQKNPSADLERALNRWSAALEEERAELEEEKRQLSDWSYEMGMRRGGIFGFLPFLGEPATEVDKIRSVEAKKFVEISAAKRDLLSEKELLYKQHGEV
ncbi:MAG: outer membrane protein assembly factor BamD, partial [Candidatus Omnitrophica bacterium]|nr:outer membrane protein assembly factor BamD [Candidatus Omnitrophota bacterium]